VQALSIPQDRKLNIKMARILRVPSQIFLTSVRGPIVSRVSLTSPIPSEVTCNHVRHQWWRSEVDLVLLVGFDLSAVELMPGLSSEVAYRAYAKNEPKRD